MDNDNLKMNFHFVFKTENKDEYRSVNAETVCYFALERALEYRFKKELNTQVFHILDSFLEKENEKVAYEKATKAIHRELLNIVTREKNVSSHKTSNLFGELRRRVASEMFTDLVNKVMPQINSPTRFMSWEEESAYRRANLT